MRRLLISAWKQSRKNYKRKDKRTEANETKTQATKGAITVFQKKLSVVQLQVRVTHYFAKRNSLT